MGSNEDGRWRKIADEGSRLGRNCRAKGARREADLDAMAEAVDAEAVDAAVGKMDARRRKKFRVDGRASQRSRIRTPDFLVADTSSSSKRRIFHGNRARLQV